jgi:hypothetical protein
VIFIGSDREKNGSSPAAYTLEMTKAKSHQPSHLPLYFGAMDFGAMPTLQPVMKLHPIQTLAPG